MKIQEVKNQSFGLNPSNALRTCIVKAGLAGADIKPLRKLIGELYPYRYMEMLGDYNKVQAVHITGTCGNVPRITKVLSPHWQEKYNAHKHPVWGNRWRDHYVDEEGQKIWKEHAFDDVVGGNVIFKDLKGKNFKDIIGTLTSKLKEIQAQQSPLERGLDEFNRGLPEYGRILTPQELKSINHACFADKRIY